MNSTLALIRRALGLLAWLAICSSARGADAGRFDLAVNNAPAAQVFMQIANGTPYSMLVTPEVAGNVSVTLKNVTVVEALESLRDLYGYDFRITGQRVLVLPNTVQSRLFRVNYLPGRRQGASDLRVNTGSMNPTGAGSATRATGRPAGAGAATRTASAPARARSPAGPRAAAGRPAAAAGAAVFATGARIFAAAATPSLVVSPTRHAAQQRAQPQHSELSKPNHRKPLVVEAGSCRRFCRIFTYRGRRPSSLLSSISARRL